MIVVVVGLGGNALLARGEEPSDAEAQRRHVAFAARSIARLAHESLVVTHGNGPQVGFLALQAAAAGEGAFPLDVLDAESVGMIGYLIDQELSNELPGRDIATLVTQVEVDPDDAAFSAPSKPIGPWYDEHRASALEAERGWTFVERGGKFRRVVPSPEPRRVVEMRAIRLLVEAGVLVICAGGGGIPVRVDASGALHGVEAVIDKDRSTALLATELGAGALLLLTGIPAVYTDWGDPLAHAIRRASPEQLRSLAFEPGSMGPKVEAACRFVDATGSTASIGALADAAAILEKRAGTVIDPESLEMELWDPQDIMRFGDV